MIEGGDDVDIGSGPMTGMPVARCWWVVAPTCRDPQFRGRPSARFSLRRRGFCVPAQQKDHGRRRYTSEDANCATGSAGHEGATCEALLYLSACDSQQKTVIVFLIHRLQPPQVFDSGRGHQCIPSIVAARMMPSPPIVTPEYPHLGPASLLPISL